MAFNKTTYKITGKNSIFIIFEMDFAELKNFSRKNDFFKS
jgi:hypothetical protein